MAQQTDTLGGRGTATLDANSPPELPASTAATSTGAGAQHQEQRTAQQVKAQVRDAASQAKEQAVKAAEQARGQVEEIVSRRKDVAADRLGSVAEALREAGRKLQEGDQGGELSHYAERAAQQVDQLSRYLRDHDLRSFVRDSEDFARRRPELVLGGSFLAGLMIARFLKSSAPERFGRGPYSAGYRDSAPQRRPVYGTETRSPGESSFATGGTTSYNAPIGA